jgi:hypothetical protein
MTGKRGRRGNSANEESRVLEGGRVPIQVVERYECTNSVVIFAYGGEGESRNHMERSKRQ